MERKWKGEGTEEPEMVLHENISQNATATYLAFEDAR